MIGIAKHLIISLLAVCIIASAVIGCAGVRQAYPEKSRYVLDVQRTGEPLTRAFDAVLKVRRFRVSSRFESHELVSRSSAVQYESDYYNIFLSSPGSMITQEVREWLAGSGLFIDAVDAGSYLDSNYLLEGEVTALYGDYSDSAKPKAVVAIRFIIIKESGTENSIAFHKDYHVTTPLASKKPEELVKGFNKCLAQILKNVEADLRK